MGSVVTDHLTSYRLRNLVLFGGARGSHELREEVVPLVVYDDEGREVLHVDFPDRLHTVLLVVQDLHLLDAVLRQDGRGPADGAEVEAAVLLAGLSHRLGPVALREGDERAAVLHEGGHVRVHAPRGGGPEGPGGEALGRFGGPRVVDDPVLGVVREPLPALEALQELGVRDVAGDHEGAREGQARADGVLGQLRADVRHRPVEVHAHHGAGHLLGGHLREELGGVEAERLDEDAVLGDLGLCLAVRGAGDAEAHGAGGAVARQADHAHVVAEVLAPELRADAHGAREPQNLVLEGEVAEGAARLVARGGQGVQVPRGRELDSLERELRREPADDDGQVVGRTRARADVADALVHELHEGLGVEHRLGLLEEEGLVGGAAALGQEKHIVLVRVRVVGEEVDLRWEVALCVLLLKHGEGRHLRVAEVALGVRRVDSLREARLIVAIREDLGTALADADRRARVLAARQNPGGRDIGVLQELHRDKAVILGGLGIIEDLAQLRQVGLAQEVRDVPHGPLRENLEGGSLDTDKLLPVAELLHRDVLARVVQPLPLRGRVLPQLEEGSIGLGEAIDIG
mmetsp:Transcript_17625/g.51187  ORF Transcript_17625/g.51187 Transcript_17625/m.51187 type:complete len:574 (+) Transcript_17625:182-1903(+)